jgi:hypothetical protein
VPEPSTRKGTLAVTYARGPAVFEVGGIWAGATKIGDPFQVAEWDGSGYRILQDRVRSSDVFGAKAKVTVQKGKLHWYAQGASMGLVADGGPTATQTFTGWRLKDSGSGNQTNFLTGLAYSTGDFQIGPNFLWQKPIVDPMPRGLSPSGAGRPRNILEDPFAVRANRETVAAEILVTYDPTPATWFWQWDNDAREDARLAASLGFIMRDLPTTQDASIGILGDGTTQFAFPAAPPPRPWSLRHGLWEMNSRIVSRLRSDVRIVAHLFAGNGEANGDDPASSFGTRLVRRYGGDARIAWGRTAFATHVKANDWGPYDYHRDFNLTFPLQLMGDISYTLGAPVWLEREQTRIGVRGTWRSLDNNSPRFAPSSLTTPKESPFGNEWEIRTYLVVAL